MLAMFTLCVDVKSNESHYVGSLTPAQALSIIQQIVINEAAKALVKRQVEEKEVKDAPNPTPG